MPDADKLYRKTSPQYRKVLRQVLEGALEPEEIAWSGLEALKEDVKRRGHVPIQLLIKVANYLAKLPSEPLFRLSADWTQINDQLDAILYSGIDVVDDKRTFGLVEEAVDNIAFGYQQDECFQIDSAEAIRIYLERLWQAGVTAMAADEFDYSEVQRLKLVEAMVLRETGSFANQIAKRPEMRHLKRPRRRYQPQINIDTNLLEALSQPHEHA